jgi:hypothetical protein
VQDLLKHGKGRKFFRGGNESPLKRVTKGNIRNHRNSGKEKEAMNIIVKVYIQAIKNIWMQIHRLITNNLQLLV